MIRTILALVASLLLATPAAAGPLLWGQAGFHDSVDQVAAVFPKAKPPSRPDSLDGAAEKLQFKDRLFDNDPFRVRFFFNDAGLRIIQLEALGLPNKATAANLTRAKALTEKVQARYGGEPLCKEQSGVLNLYACNWISGDLGLTVTYVDVAGADPLLIVAIEPASEATP